MSTQSYDIRNDTDHPSVAGILRYVDENLSDDNAYSLWQAARPELHGGGDKALLSFLQDVVREAVATASAAIDEVDALVSQGEE